MEQFSNKHRQLLAILSDGSCYSGTTLGEKLDVSRTAIWKYISQIDKLGLKIKRIPHKGYQLSSPLILLDERLIRQKLAHTQFKKSVNFYLYASLGSTSRFLKALPLSSDLEICCAEGQTQGKGRYGRNWFSPFGENIYFSGRWLLNCCFSQLSGLSLVVGLGVLSALKSHQISNEIKLKWPNDLLWKDQKLAGILIDVLGETNGYTQVIIGLGLNVNTATQQFNILDRPWCSLFDITGDHLDRNGILASLIYFIDKFLQQFSESGFKGFMKFWREVDYLQNKWITVSQPSGNLHGFANGVNALGQLCITDSGGIKHYLSIGDASLSA